MSGFPTQNMRASSTAWILINRREPGRCFMFHHV